MGTDELIRLCRDTNCPSCDWPETYAEVCFDDAVAGARALGCNKCGWRDEAHDAR